MSTDFSKLTYNDQPQNSNLKMDIARLILHQAHDLVMGMGRSDLASKFELFDANNLNLEKIKSFTGTTSATGSGIPDIIAETFGISTEYNGAIQASGVDFRANSPRDFKVGMIRNNNSKYAKSINGDVYSNLTDLTSFLTPEFRLERYLMSVEGFIDVVQASGNANEIVAGIIFLVEDNKNKLVDTIGINAILNISGTIANLPNNVGFPTIAPLNNIMGKLYSSIAHRTDRTNVPGVFYMNSGVYNRLKTEQSTTGEFVNNTLSNNFLPVAVDPGIGFGGTFMGKKIYITNEILDTYQGDVDGTIVVTNGASTNLNKSAIIYALPRAIFVRKGKAEFDKVVKFDGADGKNIHLFYANRQIFVGEVWMQGGVKDPALATYVLV